MNSIIQLNFTITENFTLKNIHVYHTTFVDKSFVLILFLFLRRHSDIIDLENPESLNFIIMLIWSC